MGKVDTRTLHPEARNELRRMAVRLRQQSGMTCESLAEIVGVHVVTVRAWIAKAKAEGAVIFFGDETAVKEDSV